MMADKIDWTTSVGQAYVNQSTDVASSVQHLRHMARDAGNLASSPQQEVIEHDDYIAISPCLFWESPEGENPSPLGKLIAAASAEGYISSQAAPAAAGKGGSDKEQAPFDRAPYHGYYFKILTRQGPHAPGGKYGYIINGNMIAGYALVAYTDKWGNSGVMTFMINQQGRVYEKNLGPNTGKLASAMTEYDPDLETGPGATLNNFAIVRWSLRQSSHASPVTFSTAAPDNPAAYPYSCRLASLPAHRRAATG